MYSDEVRNKALALLEQGLSPREVSAELGGKPGHTIIRKWSQGLTPAGKRRVTRLYSLDEKLDALGRVAAGENYHTVAAELGCAPESILGWRRRYQEMGEAGIRTRFDDARA